MRGDDSGSTCIVNVSDRRGGKSHSMGGGATSPHRRVFEGRDSNMGQVRESGIVTRAD